MTQSPNEEKDPLTFPKSFKCAKCGGAVVIPEWQARRLVPCPNCSEPLSTDYSWTEFRWIMFSTRFVDRKTKQPRLEFTTSEICDRVGGRNIKWTDIAVVTFKGSHQKLNHYRSTWYESFTIEALYVVSLVDGSEVRIDIDNLNLPPSMILSIQLPVEIKGRPERDTYTHVSAETMGFILEDVKKLPAQMFLTLIIIAIALVIVMFLAGR